MKLTRKILSLLLAVSMILSLALVGQASSFTDVPETHERYEAITELANRGIIAGYAAEDGTFNFQPDRIVTRAEMAKLLAEMFSITSSSTGVNTFTDVSDDFWARDYIVAAKDMGIISGYPDGTYLPNNQVSWQEAVKLIICALNWGDAAVQTYPNPAISDPTNEAYAAYAADWAYSYKMMAQKLGLTQSALMVATEPAPRGIIAQLFFNALSIKKAISDGKGGWTSDDNSSVADESNYKTMKNVKIVCTPEMNLETDTKTIKDGYIRILDSDGNKYDMSVAENTKYYSLIGRHVDVSYEEKGKENVIKSIKDLSKTTEIDLVKIKSVSENLIEYYTNDNFTKTAKIDFSKVDVIYNERPLEDPSAFVDLLNNARTFEIENDKALNYFGNVTIAKSNNNALITIKAYKSYYMSKAVSSTTSETEGYKVTLDGREEQLVLHVKDDINNEILKKTALTDKGTIQTTISIPTKSVVTFAESDPDSIGTHYVEFFATTAKKTGAVEEISSAKGAYKGKIKIGSSTFLVKNAEIWEKLENTSIGSNITYMTDPSNEIVYIDSVSNGNEKFAFFMEFVSGDTDEEDSAVFKFFDPEAGSTFQVVICDPEDINETLLSGKENGDLFWLRIKNNKVASGDIINVDEDASAVLTKSQAEDDDKLNDIKILTGSKVEKTTSGYKLDSQSVTVTSANGKTYYNPDLSKSSISYEKSSMITNLKYEGGSKAYVIQRQGAIKAVVLHDKYKGLLYSSPVCVINESAGQGKVNEIDTRKYSYYNFKTGVLSSNDLVIDASVASTLNLQKGDIITYYSDSETNGIHIDKAETVYILLRASEVAQNRGENVTAILDNSAKNAADEDYRDGFKKYSISATNVMGSSYYNYTLSLPLWYDYDINQLALTRNLTITKSYLPKDPALTEVFGTIFANGGTWNKTSILEAMTDLTQKTVPSGIKIFIFDNDAPEESRLIGKSGMTTDEVKEILSGLQTLEANNISSAEEISAVAQECSLIYSYFTNTSEGMTVLYIIK